MNERTEQRTVARRLCEQIADSFGWIKGQIQKNPLRCTIVGILLLILVWVIVETRRLDNLGFGDKAFWDWMDLLIIPIVLAIGAWWLNKSERETEREIAEQNREEDRRIADERRNQATLEAYFDRMVELLVENDLVDEESEDKKILSIIARTRTLAVLRTLDGKRKGHVVQFLHESGLINPLPVVRLTGADLSGANLGRANLGRANLSKADLTGAHLAGAGLYETVLDGANLTEADLRGANLGRASMTDAYLVGTNLGKTHLGGADLVGANLSGADLREANLSEADLSRADLTGARVADEQLAQAMSLTGTTLPDGTIHE